MRDRRADLIGAGADVAAVGCGSVEQAEALVDELKLPFPVFADPEREAFGAAELRRDLFTLNPLRTTGPALRALRAGARQRGIQGDPWQLGGTFVIAPGDRVLYEHRSQAAGDHAPWDEVTAALA